MNPFNILLNKLDSIWMDEIRESQKQYNKPICLNPNDGTDWKRELI